MGKPKPRPREELIRLLSEQRQALAASCKGYDEGNEWEAARLATSVYTLVHDGGAIRSLLTQLGLRASLRFLSSGRVKDIPGMVIMSPPLLKFRGSAKGMTFLPRFDAMPEDFVEVQFPTWWEKESIYKGSGSKRLTRRRLVFALRHQDGGGHVGALTDKSYVHFKSGGGWFGGIGDGPSVPLDMAATASMRQVAWEVTVTLNKLGEVI